MNDKLTRLHELELRIGRAYGRRPNHSSEELAQMSPEMRDAFMSLRPSAPVSARPARSRKQPTDVYRLYDAAGALLYVGLSLNVAARMGSHRQSLWWPTVVRIEKETLPDRDAASLRERELISTLAPLHNRNRGGA